MVILLKVETIKAERDVIESELKSATTDMQATFLNALTQDGGVNEPALSMDSLHRVYGSLQKQVADSLAKQERIISQIQVRFQIISLRHLSLTLFLSN